MNKVDVAEVENTVETMTPQVSISGPTTVDHGENETWTANVTGCGSTKIYEWYYKPNPAAPWGYGQYTSTSSNSDSYFHAYYNYDWDPYQGYFLRVELQCQGESGMWADEYYITVNPI
ncbi:MAG: hypothetical protein JJU13_13160 [Balneolaceae bacterium]|nr:hypothetical protein [Balneolaceae bacterium]